jgi:uncharacterized protein (DUF2062 family)
VIRLNHSANSIALVIINIVFHGDDSSGLCYYGARYLTPWLSRWISPDSVGVADGLNLYVYVGNKQVVSLALCLVIRLNHSANSIALVIINIVFYGIVFVCCGKLVKGVVVVPM